jgi:hypothetical protein
MGEVAAQIAAFDSEFNKAARLLSPGDAVEPQTLNPKP